MIREIYLEGKVIEYEFQYKNVKNINLRIKGDGRVYVSANRFVPDSAVEDFITSKAEFIIRAQEKFKNRPETEKVQYFTEEEIKVLILKLCDEVSPYFEKCGIKYNGIKFRKMVSQWGNCHVKKGVLTFNTNLMYAPADCAEYVVKHEFTHFIQPNHSERFYKELEKICPDWREKKKMLKEITIR